AVPEMRWVAVTRGAATVGRHVAPSPAPYREALPLVEVAQVRCLAARVGPVPARTELPDVAQHVAQPEAIGAIRADRGAEGLSVVHRHDGPRPLRVYLLQRFIASVDDLAGRVLLATPPEACTAASPAGPLPLRLRRQVEVQAALLLREPFAERLAVGVA